MKRFLIAGIAAVSTLAVTPMAFADPPAHARGNGAQHCNGPSCRGRVNPGHGPNDIRHGGRHLRGHSHDRSDGDVTINVTNIQIGTDASDARYWDYRSGYGIAPAPPGQEYRVINGQLVLVDSQTLQVMALMGLLSALVN
ncbi:hypothetical protein JI664_16510 [Rhodobacter sp. NTK016B]|uniref:hypothetical protein n=1 Tax=Rhodobacter sp. NTK016B TaxID=2759676 RepID=UPI001A8EC4D5|nr:hypothetical protein [Rhodobacter sp. NTK016B]MBN8293576.1 hypothetical protein [Rhodobacter sp. NTK016B]